MKLFGKSGQAKGGRGRQEAVSRAAAPNGSPAAETDREKRIRELGGDLLARARRHKAGVLNARFYQDKLMDWSMKDHDFKVQLFRFVDTYPVLTTPQMVHEHLADYLSQPGVELPPGMDLGLRAGGVAKGLMAGTISKQITAMARNFIAGTDARSALPKLEKLWRSGIGFSVDLLGEACVSSDEADMYKAKYLDLIENLPETVNAWLASETLETDHLGRIPRTNISIKVSSLSALLDPIDPDRAMTDAMKRLEPILETARDRGVFINFDMEQAALKNLTIDLFERCCERIDFEAGIAMQAYLRSGVADARRVADWARRSGRQVTVRLVKGAYWDYETIHAEQMGWPSKVWGEKWQSDRCFEDMAEVFLDSTPTREGEGGVKLALGSHNVRSIAAALEGLERRGLPRSAIELQMLHGMADELKKATADAGDLRVREYVPVGEMIPGMAYLVRRLLENTSNESWLRAGFLEGAADDRLLAPPEAHKPDRAPVHANGNGQSSVSIADLYKIAPERHALTPAVNGVGDGRPFFNEPWRDFSEEPVRKAFAEAIERTEVPRVANDRTPEQGLEMIAKAHAAFPAWRDFDPIKRASVLTRTAEMMRRRRDELSAVVIKESAKPWRDADGDVCEAIDFMEYYARLAPGLFGKKRLGKFIGEFDQLWHQPRGVAAVISPWNFPLAICTGMTSAALVTGNTVVVKPAEQSPGVAKLMHDMVADALRAEDAPADVLHFCPAPGETTGAALVRDPRVALIAFTGSKAVGLDIVKQASHVDEDAGQRFVKRVVCEMGGKNAIIVDSSADLDEAVLGVRSSAFGYAGQKCSACSRCIVVDPEGPNGPHMTQFLRRLIASTASLIVGDAADPGALVSPVIDEEAYRRIQRFIETAKNEEGCELALDMPDFEADHGRGGPRHCVGPKIFTNVDPRHTLAQQEVFGPVLAVMHAPSFEAALELANDHRYKLTGAVYSRKPANIEHAREHFRVGNLYINRGSTGSLVARMPFGGFGLSGVGSKSGGPEYLLQFVEPRACCENTMRRGFAPEL